MTNICWLTNCRFQVTLHQTTEGQILFKSSRWKKNLLIVSQIQCACLCVNPLGANFINWSNTLKQFVGKLPTNCLRVFDHFVGLAFKRLKVDCMNAYQKHLFRKMIQIENKLTDQRTTSMSGIVPHYDNRNYGIRGGNEFLKGYFL